MTRHRVSSGVLVFILSGTSLAAAGVGGPGQPESHCVLRVVDQESDGRLVFAPRECYKTFAEAQQAADSGLGGDQRIGASSFTLGVHFDGLNGTGSSISVVGSSCSGGYWNTGGAWANRISSSWNGCYRLRHHDLPNASGSYGDTAGAGSTQNVPTSINNKAESVSYWSS